MDRDIEMDLNRNGFKQNRFKQNRFKQKWI